MVFTKLKVVLNKLLCCFGIHETEEQGEFVTCIHCGDKMLLSRCYRLGGRK